MTVKNPRRVDKERTQKRARSELSGLKWAEVLDALHARLPVQGSHTLANAETFHDAWHESRRTATAEEVKRGVAVDPDTRPLDPSSSSADPDPKRLKPATVTNVENPADQMDKDTSLRTPATSHPLDPDAEENVSKKGGKKRWSHPW